MKIFLLEGYKLLRQRILIALTALLLTVTAVYAIMNNSPSDNINKEQESYSETYHVFITGMQSRADNQSGFSVFSDNGDFAKRNIVQTPKDFADLRDIVLVNGDYTGIETGTSDLLTDIFVLAIIFTSCIFLFSTEREKNLLILVKSTKNGHAVSAATRLAVLLTCTFVCCLLFYGIRLIIILAICGTPPLDAPIQSSSMFVNYSLRINVLQYILLWFGAKVLIIYTIGCLFSAVFLLLKSSGIICFVCTGIIVSEYGLFALIPESSYIAYIRQYGSVILEAPAYSLPAFSDAPSGLTILVMLVLQYMFRLLLFISAAIIAAVLSELTENSFLTITGASLMFIIPSVIICSLGLSIIIGIGSGYLWLIVIMGFTVYIVSMIIALSAARKFTGRSIFKSITERRKYHGAKA